MLQSPSKFEKNQKVNRQIIEFGKAGYISGIQSIELAEFIQVGLEREMKYTKQRCSHGAEKWREMLTISQHYLLSSTFYIFRSPLICCE
jgi:hypothetical protein